jgi:hypothetical protein
MEFKINVGIRKRWWFNTAFYVGAVLILCKKLKAETLADWLALHAIKYEIDNA